MMPGCPVESAPLGSMQPVIAANAHTQCILDFTLARE